MLQHQRAEVVDLVVNAVLLLALKRSSKIKSVIVRHEQAASFMACGYAICSNRLGLCFATAGPGAFNLFSGLRSWRSRCRIPILRGPWD